MENTAALTLMTTEKKTRAKRTVKATEIVPATPAFVANTEALHDMYKADVSDQVQELYNRGDDAQTRIVGDLLLSVSTALMSISTIEQFNDFRGELMQHARKTVEEARKN